MIAWSDNPECVWSRHKLTPSIIASGILGVAIGTSITQGVHTSGSSSWFSNQLGAKLTAATGKTCAISNRGVAHSNILTALMYVSDVVDMGTTGNAAPLGLKSGSKAELVRPLLILDTPRNDVGVFDPDIYDGLLDLLIRQCRKKCITLIIRTPPPLLNWSGVTGDPYTIEDNDPAFQSPWLFSDFYDRIIARCESRGVSLVDTWKKLIRLHGAGFDLTKWMYDGVHPNDFGTADEAQDMTLCLLRGCDDEPAPWNDGLPVLFPDIIANYFPHSGVTTTTAISGIVTPGMARNDELVEGGNFAFALSSGQSQKYRAPVPVIGIIAAFVDGPSNKGAVTATLDGAAFGSTLACATGLALEDPAWAVLAPSDPLYAKSGDVCLTYASGNPLLSGVLFICAQQTACDDTPVAAWSDAGGWAIGTFNGSGSPLNGNPCWECSTVGKSIEFVVHGRYLMTWQSQGPARGAIDLSVDGAAATNFDCYKNIPVNDIPFVVDMLTEGDHRITITLAAKNPSASATLVEIGSFRTFTMIPSNTRASVPQAGIAADERQKFT